MNEIIIALIVSSISLIILLQRDKLSKKYGFYDNPRRELKKIHKYPISNIGGLVCLIPFLISIVLSFLYEDLFTKRYLIVIFFSSLGFYFLGRLDDIENIPANRKFLAFTLIFLFLFPLEPGLLVYNIHFKYLDTSIVLNAQGNTYPIFFTLFCIFLFYNASNFIDGINGLYGSTIIFWLVFLFFVNDKYSVISITIIFSLILFLYFNLQNKIFLGNSGNSFISCFVASLYIFSYNNFGNLYCDQVFFAFLIPGFDTLRVSIVRLINKKSPFYGDNNHLHHFVVKKIGPKYSWFLILILILAPIVFLEKTENFFLSLFFAIFIYFITLFFFNSPKKSKFN